MEIYRSLEQNYVDFDGSRIHVVINDENVYFNANNTTSTLGYKDLREALRNNVPKRYIKQLKVLVDHNIPGIHPNSLYLSESGLYRLLVRSRMPKAQKFADWIYDELIPSVRKFHVYRLKKDYENQLFLLSKRLDYIEKQKKLYEKEMKKEKYPSGSLVYVIDYSTDDEEIYRIGQTDDMAKRKRVYDTHTLYKHTVVITHETPCPIKFESCLRTFLYDYRYKNNKDFYICSLKKIKQVIKMCERSIAKCDKQIGGSKTAKIRNTPFITIIDRIKIRKHKLRKQIIDLSKLLSKNNV